MPTRRTARPQPRKRSAQSNSFWPRKPNIHAMQRPLGFHEMFVVHRNAVTQQLGARSLRGEVFAGINPPSRALSKGARAARGDPDGAGKQR
jgi:hypothetical protein